MDSHTRGLMREVDVVCCRVATGHGQSRVRASERGGCCML